MRLLDTYRCVRREAAKSYAKANGLSFAAYWPTSIHRIEHQAKRGLPRMPESKYMPHQGKRECARRIRQMEARS
ncbi:MULTISPECIES: hypothetical protein [unclassified Mesorhizobium]|uniref:hypothetical protein n=1 Tax=unclassified Mesorhizobium TaxID=325217 RepID=UPI00112A575D|nr:MULTISPECIES: hypothetical protein [unclassified Mesorhizobium]TPJ70482.1 hypothetical protein FJ462_07245 [Mesorhizobium sp. B2-6-7]TPJ76861.1 hypothetical protein FJ422_29575 [Mesorhizobium sp. B2-6-3]